MEFRLRRRSDALHVSLSGRLGAAHVRTLQARIEGALDGGSGPPPSRLVIDLARLETIAVAGVALLMHLKASCRASGRDFAVVRAGPEVERALLPGRLGRPDLG